MKRKTEKKQIRAEHLSGPKRSAFCKFEITREHACKKSPRNKTKDTSRKKIVVPDRMRCLGKIDSSKNRVVKRIKFVW